jgi:hypothetical protein
LPRGRAEHRAKPHSEADPSERTVLFNNNARDHALRNAAEFAVMISAAKRQVPD